MMSMHGFVWQLCFRLELKRVDGENSVKEIMNIYTMNEVVSLEKILARTLGFEILRNDATMRRRTNSLLKSSCLISFVNWKTVKKIMHEEKRRIVHTHGKTS